LLITAGDKPKSRPAADILPAAAIRANISRSEIAVTGTLTVSGFPVSLPQQAAGESSGSAEDHQSYFMVLNLTLFTLIASISDTFNKIEQGMCPGEG
jgi:hypothetical protein